MVYAKEDYRVSYAQNREDVILAAFFEGVQQGFYVDVGANDPEIDSVTKYFYDQGWSGINIEPQHQHFVALERQRSRDINLNIGIGEEEGELTLRQYKGNGLSTFSPEMKEEYLSNPSRVTSNYIDVEVQVKPLSAVFTEQQVGNIHFMKVDVEGLEYEVLASNDWKRWRPQVICIETNHIKKDWRKLLTVNNYESAFSDGLNEYFIDKRVKGLKANFSYVNSVLLGKPILPSYAIDLIKKSEEKVKSLASENTALQEEKAELQEELLRTNAHVVYLQNELDQIISLKSHVKKFLKKRVKNIDHKIELTLRSNQVFHPAKPTTDADIIAAAHRADIQNLQAYNLTFIENAKTRFYRKSKQIAKAVIRRGGTN